MNDKIRETVEESLKAARGKEHEWGSWCTPDIDAALAWLETLKGQWGYVEDIANAEFTITRLRDTIKSQESRFGELYGIIENQAKKIEQLYACIEDAATRLGEFADEIEKGTE